MCNKGGPGPLWLYGTRLRPGGYQNTLGGSLCDGAKDSKYETAQWVLWMVSST